MTNGGRNGGPVNEEGLTMKQMRFVEEYLTCWNGSEAARRAGYAVKTAHVQATDNLRNPKIRAAIDRRLRDFHLGADEVLARMADQAMTTLDDLLSMRGGKLTLDLTKAKRLGKLHLVKKVTTTKQGMIVELHDSQRALDMLARTLGLYIDKIAPTDPTGTKPYEALTDDERAARIAAILERARARRAGQPAEPTDQDADASA
jgi:hypothetical protein